ncbi:MULTISPECIES: FtsW/RodA/SpoVE family cell cycle protein [Campylobacter]|uniref:Probable peptidoglycan glycosyltransferase FtsW n=1 Tax=Campylobacter curvus (strain 525.92) TaxID=360105 RepID=A7GYM1_CAMC5|nr:MULTISPECIES: FtsW/RodA/SpoVE family cell cycle protein [Campylobacter]EAU00547.1 cell division protein, FtsW/RodA/SpoVE family [Campylobacter curvus 525.92]MBN7288509.1 FtsW/RodA/SpoVE family cell cycle protein [Campylobacter curvus]MDU6827283.1 FtsW/RodA/SpoVE family cell cycle protein [Campylobacter sp.]QKF61307.1 cell division protein, FtsW/RodA/SpoVE family [Campylobacter curvus]UEB49620.1 FtsW/RodA/SpoVE family cell cycle protein [Campylobacter curvus]
MAVDKIIFYLCVTLITISIIFSLSLPVFTVLFFNYEEYHFFIRQFAVGCIGVFLMWWLSRLNPDKALVWIGFGLFGLCIIAMGLMHALPASMVTDAGGARRWIRLPGFSLAPVEFFKIGFVYFLAWSFTRKIDDSKKSLKDELKLLLPYICVFLIVVYLIAVLQNDLGQVIVLALTFVTMALFAGASAKIFSIGILGAAFIMTIAIVSSEHRILRIKSWWGTIQGMVLSLLPDSVADVLRVADAPEPYQISHSLNAIKHGEFFGEGLGAGIFKLGFLSEVHTDFVLAGIAEEIGVFGILCIVAILLTLLYRIFRISARSENKVYHLFSLGIGLIISFSFLMNSYGITSITPIKGIAVPFLSYGGSSILAICIGIGMVLMVSKRANL